MSRARGAMICVQNGRPRYRQAKNPAGENGTEPLRSAFRRHPLLVSAFVLFTLLALFFAGRFATRVAYWSTHQNQPVAEWMTVGYIAHSWHLDTRELETASGLPPPAGHPLTLGEIARERGVPVSEIIAAVEAAIARLQADKQTRRPP